MSDGAAHANSVAATDVDVVVVGAGFAGLYLLHRLRALGFSAHAFEAGSDVGGTWYWNRYPGARCDAESLAYSYSFSPELEQEWEWTERYAGQPEILRYLNHVADRFDLRRDISLRTRVTAATFDERILRWRVRTDAGDELSAQFCVMATGCLSAPKTPDLPGLGDFAGRVLETARWPHEAVDFTGRRVGVIGTGSTGIQLIPVVAETAGQLTVFQRTPNFSIPARNRPLEPGEVDAFKAHYDQFRARQRTSPSGTPLDAPPTQSVLEVERADLTAMLERLWANGGLTPILSAYTDLMTNAEANEIVAEFIRAKIRATVRDPATAAALCPHDHPFGTKRPCLDTNYYETYNRPNVVLVDLRTDPIVAITEGGVRTEHAETPLDDLVLATGFDAITGALLSIDVRGRGGTRLADRWAAGPRTYLGLGVAGFPNLFTVTGPGSPSVLSTMTVSIEQHVEWITDCLVALRDEGQATIEAEPDAEDAWVAHVNDLAAQKLYDRANSWYLGANVVGKPRVFMPYTGGVGTYRAVCDAVAANGYEGFTRA